MHLEFNNMKATFHSIDLRFNISTCVLNILNIGFNNTVL